MSYLGEFPVTSLDELPQSPEGWALLYVACYEIEVEKRDGSRVMRSVSAERLRWRQ